MVDEGDIEEKSSYSNFMFSTRGGATSCPYEDEIRTEYFEPGQHILSERFAHSNRIYYFCARYPMRITPDL